MNGGTKTPRLLRQTTQMAVRHVLAAGNEAGWVAWCRTAMVHLAPEPCLGERGHLDASPPSANPQMAVRHVLAQGKAVGLGCCCRTALVHLAPEPRLGGRGALKTASPPSANHADGGSACARTGESCRAGVLLPHCTGAPCTGAVPGRTGSTKPPRPLRQTTQMAVRHVLAVGKLSGWGAVAALHWCTLHQSRAWVDGEH